MTWLFVIALAALIGCTSSIMSPRGSALRYGVPADERPAEAQERRAVLGPAKDDNFVINGDSEKELDKLSTKITHARDILNQGEPLLEHRH